jgi:hypothetical protein
MTELTSGDVEIDQSGEVSDLVAEDKDIGTEGAACLQ